MNNSKNKSIFASEPKTNKVWHWNHQKADLCKTNGFFEIINTLHFHLIVLHLNQGRKRYHFCLTPDPTHRRKTLLILDSPRLSPQLLISLLLTLTFCHSPVFRQRSHAGRIRNRRHCRHILQVPQIFSCPRPLFLINLVLGIGFRLASGIVGSGLWSNSCFRLRRILWRGLRRVSRLVGNRLHLDRRSGVWLWNRIVRRRFGWRREEPVKMIAEKWR